MKWTGNKKHLTLVLRTIVRNNRQFIFQSAQQSTKQDWYSVNFASHFEKSSNQSNPGI
jgi:hypothetical protein